LRGAPIAAENNTAMPADFLMQQMAWREALEEAADAAAVEELADEVATARRREMQALAETADDAQDFPALAQQVRALMFVERFARDVDNRRISWDNKPTSAGPPQRGSPDSPTPHHGTFADFRTRPVA
jgi:molecular chaperone HscB